jgi:hypothetical protein
VKCNVAQWVQFTFELLFISVYFLQTSITFQVHKQMLLMGNIAFFI